MHLKISSSERERKKRGILWGNVKVERERKHRITDTLKIKHIIVLRDEESYTNYIRENKKSKIIILDLPLIIDPVLCIVKRNRKKIYNRRGT